MEQNHIIELVISVISLFLCIFLFVAIRKNSENIFFSMRSSNLMQITNLSIFMSIFLYFINDKFGKMPERIYFKRMGNRHVL